MVLSGWKEVSDYLRCGVRTVQRWEKNALPVHRPLPGKRSHVIAYSEELDWWVRVSKNHCWPRDCLRCQRSEIM